MYNCPERIASLRRDFPNTRAGSDIEWSLKQTVKSLDFKLELIDPYNVAGLIALAQEQLGVFSRLNQTAPDALKVRSSSFSYRLQGIFGFYICIIGAFHITTCFPSRSISLHCEDPTSLPGRVT